MDAGDAVADLLAHSGDRLLRFAFQLCHDRAGAEDLVQQALEQVYRRWQARGVVEFPEAYVRRAMLNEFLRQGRLAGAGEVVTDVVPERPVADVADAVVARDPLWRVLGGLPPRQRAALVLRFYEDLPDAEIARLLGCRRSSVRSLVARGLTGLRGVIDASSDAPGRAR